MFSSVSRRMLLSRVPLYILLISFVLGFFALQYTPREEEPQIVVPMLDIHVEVPNVDAPEVTRLVTEPLEKLLMQIPGVEHVYSTTVTGKTRVTLRFEVGEDRERAILNTYTKLYANEDRKANVVSNWQIKPVEVDDVAILMLGIYSQEPDRYSDYELTRIAQEVSTQLQTITNTNEVNVLAGRTRQVQVELDATSLAAHHTTPLDVFNAIQYANQLKQVGAFVAGKAQWQLQTGDVLRSDAELKKLVVNVINGKQIYLTDVAKVTDGPSEPTRYQWLSRDRSSESLPMVTISVAKQRGSNAVMVSRQVLARMAELESQLLPDGVSYQVLRNYGQTADDKVDHLTASLAFAVLSVIIFVGVFLGWRPAIVIGLAIPICYGITLIVGYVFGYTINRVTLFALILALGLLVDDPITGMDNITRFVSRRGNKPRVVTLAMLEVKTPLLISTLTIIVAFIPLGFITGMMGPYMAPMAFNIPLSVVVSTLVALFITPWLAMKLLSGQITEEEQAQRESTGSYRRLLAALLMKPRQTKWLLWLVLGAFILSVSLPVMRAVPLKLLPFDNKNEVQVLIDLPEGSSLEYTASVAQKVQNRLWQLPEVSSVAAYVGSPSSMDFNGMVRGYYQRHGNHLADLRVLLIDKNLRAHQSHEVVLRMRDLLASLAQDGVHIKVVEVPPGPPVMSTLVAEVYKEDIFADDSLHQQAAVALAQRLQQEAHVIDVDTSIASQSQVHRFVLDKRKAALSGISTQDVNNTLQIASAGVDAGLLHVPNEAEPLSIELQMSYEDRNRWSELNALQVRGRYELSKTAANSALEDAARPLVPIYELGQWQQRTAQQPIYRKDLAEVIYVTAELNGRVPAAVIADIVSDEGGAQAQAREWHKRTFITSGAGIAWQMPEGTYYTFSGEGEWRITVDVFRDMGIAFAFALSAIFLILRVQTASSALAGIIMSSIPLTMIGIMPGFWLLNQFGERSIAGAPEPVLFSATAMIGMIALAGIVVRNSLILIEFVNQQRAQGVMIKEALYRAGEVRMRPVLLAAGTTMLGNIVIIFDPVFSGLALAIIFGTLASTLLSLVVVPVVYYLVFNDEAIEESKHAAGS
ncbi:efflux RND transporter permease subunit [Pseudoalteromonas luteoviolacea]|uniref:efflux RND transporter permease subunit n=1 Tax=Pseudoalteromonas luteoviolacea TaxID=43657 RepID=UPI00114EA4BD|nr:efflux RND transporter permease subunit [Pseudoalteromonas luteoviolacea]TQF72745.1 efflux RND transporter permease subunit [Pseudoalteromonas luteoviolacea]